MINTVATPQTYVLSPQSERLFTLHWDNSKSRKVDADKFRRQEARGIRWADGSISIDNGNVFENVNEMEILLGLAGQYSIRWDGEQ